ncbi:signal transduction histidine kinase [Saccharothrix tamanrassetensis]|uniref:histidine kinase n=1 Tax=Saccharothrix tamanrassetensis TaxID=1051531 RepID=A0A841CTE3_9PSEU|nr:histidine kinase [Saccharothrix tamanrassetensis]MBB5960569.1 signal transduction histidine kinase [Saccharothrix tamanrassetensis]
MESTHLGWRTLARRQWPLACALLFFNGTEALAGDTWWQTPGTVVVGALAVLAPRRPFDAALTGAMAVLGGSVLLRLSGEPSTVPLISGLTLSEGAAVMAIIAIVVRQEAVKRAVSGTLALVAAAAVTQAVRPSYWQRHYSDIPYDGPGFWQQAIGAVVLLVLSVGTGLYFRARDRERATLVRSEVTAAQHAERMALARELHDVVAHYVTGIVVHAQAAQAVPGAAQEVLPIIAQSGNEALTAMRRLVGTLRGSETDAPAASSDLADDVKQVVAQSGQPVRLSLDLPSVVPPSLGRSVLRLVQESLTNTRKHAEDVSRVDVSVAVVSGVVHVVIADDGRDRKTAPVGGSGGFGLVGMRERVELLGGRFAAGQREGGGWEVRAELPLAE